MTADFRDIGGRRLGTTREAIARDLGVALALFANRNPDVKLTPRNLQKISEFLDEHPDMPVTAASLEWACTQIDDDEEET